MLDTATWKPLYVSMDGDAGAVHHGAGRPSRQRFTMNALPYAHDVAYWSDEDAIRSDDSARNAVMQSRLWLRSGHGPATLDSVRDARGDVMGLAEDIAAIPSRHRLAALDASHDLLRQLQTRLAARTTLVNEGGHPAFGTWLPGPG